MKRADIMPISRMTTICMPSTTLRKPQRRTPISVERRTGKDGGIMEILPVMDELVDHLKSQQKYEKQEVKKERGGRLHTGHSLDIDFGLHPENSAEMR
jgi:hypothetical protein